jgi:uncharacterized protein (DUF58 family)
MIVLGLFPLIFLALGLLIGQPQEVEAHRRGKDLKVWVDGQIADSLDVSVKGGVGLVTVSDLLPKSFRLDEGTNFKALWKGAGDLDFSFSYKATCAKRGLYELESVSWEARHPLGITQNRLGETPVLRTYIVQPRSLFVRRIRERRGLTRVPMPMDAKIKFGAPTTDFREIRDYASGDSYRMINWKATSRVMPTSPRPLQVNEYEREGKKMVWIFLDSATHMSLGTTVQNTLEYSIRASLGLTQFYLSRQCRVGLCIYDHDAYLWRGPFQRTSPPLDLSKAFTSMEQLEVPITNSNFDGLPQKSRHPTKKRIIFPDVGRRQQYRIAREMLKVDVGYSDESLKEAVHSCRGHIIGTRPLFIIITMIDASKMEGLIEGIRELHKYTVLPRQIRVRSSILVFNIRGYSIAATSEVEDMAAEMLEFENRRVYEALRRFGATIVTWNPKTQNFSRVLLEQRS